MHDSVAVRMIDAVGYSECELKTIFGFTIESKFSNESNLTRSIGRDVSRSGGWIALYIYCGRVQECEKGGD